MSLPVTKLDDIDFEKLVADARALIPQYAPDWTDHNLHDPGITLIELLAWITDQEIFRIGFGYRGDRYRKAFAALLGVRPTLAQPARGLIWPAKPLTAAVHVKKGAPVVSVEQPDIPFRLEDDVFLTDAVPQRAQAAAGGKRFALGNVQATGDIQYPRSAISQQIPSNVTLYFDRPLVRAPAASGAFEVISLGIAVDAPAAPPDAEVKDPKQWGPLVFDYQVFKDKPDDLGWQRIAVAHDGTFALARTGVVLLRIPSGGDEKQQSALRLRLDLGFFPVTPELTRLAVNALSMVQLAQHPAGVLGHSTALPDQMFDLDLSGLPAPADDRAGLTISIDDGKTSTPCTAVDDFTNSDPQDTHFVADLRRDRIYFGNGIDGQIPPAGAQIEYSAFDVTRGAAGNLGSGLRWRVAGVTGDFGNPEPTAQGRDASSVDDLIAQARALATGRDALLTKSDLQRAVADLPGFGISRAEVLARYDPRFPGQDIRGTRALIVIPDRDATVDPAVPVPQRYLDEVEQALAPRRLIGERLSVVGPGHVGIDITLRLLVGAGADTSELQDEVKADLEARLSDLRQDDDVEPWPLGRPVTISEIEGRVARISGVLAVLACRIARAGGVGAGDDDNHVELAKTEIAIAGTIDIGFQRESGGSV
jgi:Baseplate J-like protein